jgi:hypothetical protein
MTLGVRDLQKGVLLDRSFNGRRVGFGRGLKKRLQSPYSSSYLLSTGTI